jgi:DNA-directed RNA polymerase specialized sigma24 family protein
MKNEEYLGMIEKLNLLINNKILEKEELFTIATKTTQENDGMPHATGTSDKVGNGTVKLLEKEAEIDRVIDLFYDLKQEIIGQIQKLPAAEYDVLHKSFVQGISLADIATEKNKHIDTIKKVYRSGIKNVRILETRNLKEARKMLFDAA